MSHNSNPPEGKDPQLWETAKRRVAFKGHAATYVVINIFLWILWYITGRDTAYHTPWAVWPMLGWGIGLLFHFLGAYVFTKSVSVEKEYEKLKQQQ